MSAFQVHPHFCYLNSDVCLVNNSDLDIQIKDQLENKEYSVPASSHITVRLTAGEHKFVDSNDAGVSETVIVEDAIKLGGSKEKKSFVFEGTPWAIMIMLDRSYFYNRDTKEQYVEHGLVPDNILFLNENYLLFTTENDNSLFSLKSLTIIKTISDSTFLYSNANYALFSIEGALELFSLVESSDKETEVIHCDDYAINRSKQCLYYHFGGKKVFSIKQLENTDSIVTSKSVPEYFRCFVGDHSVVYGNTPRSINIVNIENEASACLYDGPIPVTTINGKEIWKNRVVSLMQNNDVDNAFTASVVLSVYERPNRWVTIRDVSYYLKNNGSPVLERKYSLHISDKEGTCLESSSRLELIEGNSFDCIKKSNKHGVIVQAGEITEEYEGEIWISPNKQIIICNDNGSSVELIDPINPNFPGIYDKYESEKLFKECGMVLYPSDWSAQADSSDNIYYNLDYHHGVFIGKCNKLKQDGLYRTSGKKGDFIHSINDARKPMPCTEDRLISVSEEINYALVHNEEGIILMKYSSDERKWISTAIGEMKIDESFYSKAVFSSDGNTIIYQKKEGPEFYLRNLGSEDETTFEMPGSVIKRNINGYIPYLDFDSHRRPVYVDPVTLTRVEYAAAGQFTFQSVDGAIKHVGHNTVKYYDLMREEYVTKETYDQFVDKFNFERQGLFGAYKKEGSKYEEVVRNREGFYKSNQEWIDDRIKKTQPMFSSFGTKPTFHNKFLDIPNVCDELLFRKDYYVTESYKGELIEIKLPKELWFLNYVSYSYDNRYIVVSGRFPDAALYKGLALIYDINERKIIYQSTNTMAVWLGVFNKKSIVGYYDSTPNTYISNNISNKESYKILSGRSFLAFSPSGKYIALSKQGYIPYSPDNPYWGHQPSRDVFIATCESKNKELAHYRDHGTVLEGYEHDRSNQSVASATFSSDDKKLMTVSRDGVVVVRNLHLEDDSERMDSDIPF